MTLIFLKYECVSAYRNKLDFCMPLLFFVLTVSLYPLAIGSNAEQLRLIAPGIVWVAAVLAVLLSLPPLFKEDAQSGYLDRLILSENPLALLVLIKVLVHWMKIALPLVFLSPVLGLLFHLDSTTDGVLMLSLLLGTPTLLLLGAIGVALTVSLNNQALLLPLLMLPLCMPVLIWGAGSVSLASTGLAYAGQIALLGAMLLAALSLAPLAIAFALRIGAMT